MTTDENGVRTLASQSQVTRLGRGAILTAGELARQQGITRALVVMDPGLAQTAGARELRHRLQMAGIQVTECDTVTPTPLYSDVEACTRLAVRDDCDGVVSYGGGSALDVGKVTALLAKHGGTIHEYAHGQRVVDSTLPHVAISTTAGTGAESSSYAFLLEEQGHEHTILWHDIMVPEVAILDPEIHATMPPALTAATGLNALSDAIEAYLSLAHSPESDEAALQAIRLISTHLPRAYEHGDDLEARAAMAEGAYLAGVAFNLAGLGIVDSISLVLSSLFNIGHSSANAIVLPHVMAYDAWHVEERMGDLADALGQPRGEGRQGMAEAAIQGVVELKQQVHATQSLADRGLSWDDLYLCAHAILRHPFIKRNPRTLDEAGLQEILLNAMDKQRIRVERPPDA